MEQNLELGYIPEKVGYLISPRSREDDTLVEISDAGDRAILNKSIKNCAYKTYDYTTRSMNTTEPFLHIVDNPPTSGYKLVDTHSGYFYRNHTVMLPNGLTAEVLDNVFLYKIIMEKGISAGGILNGEFVFAKIDKKYQLIPTDCEIYNKLIENSKGREKTAISPKKLKPLHVYASRSGTKSIFLGFTTIDNKKKEVWFGVNSYYGNEDLKNKLNTLVVPRWYHDGIDNYFQFLQHKQVVHDLGDCASIGWNASNFIKKIEGMKTDELIRFDNERTAAASDPNNSYAMKEYTDERRKIKEEAYTPLLNIK